MSTEPSAAAPTPEIGEGAWPAPTTLGSGVLDARPLPTDSLLPVQRSFVEAVAEFTQTDPGLALLASLGAVAACGQRSRYVQVQPGWSENLGNYAAAAVGPGNRKSAVLSFITEEIEQYEEAQRFAYREQRKAHFAREGASEEDAPVCARVLADDATPESLVSLSAKNHGSIGIVSAEGVGLFEIAAGRYRSGGGVNFETLLKGHGGDVIRVDRKRGESIYIRRPSWSIFVMTQPDAVEGFARMPHARALGLLARFLFYFPRSKVGHRRYDVRPVPPTVRAQWAMVLRSLLAVESGPRRPLTLSEDALGRFLSFARQIEARQAAGGDLYAFQDWASKLAGATARLSGQFALVRDAETNVVTRDDVERVLHLVPVLIEHALVALQSGRESPSLAAAGRILQWVKAGRFCEFSRRDVWQALRGQSWLSKVTDLDEPIAALHAHGYPRGVAGGAGPKGPGRPPSPRFVVSPHLRRIPINPNKEIGGE